MQTQFASAIRTSTVLQITHVTQHNAGDRTLPATAHINVLLYCAQVLLGAAGTILPEEVPTQLAYPGAVPDSLPRMHRGAERRRMVH